MAEARLNAMLLSLGQVHEGFEPFDLPVASCPGCSAVFTDQSALLVVDKNGVELLACKLCRRYGCFLPTSLVRL
jgi:hypothetical protein